MRYQVIQEDQCHCLECGKEMGYGGRTDRKFCSSVCKNKYNNRKARDSRIIKRRVLANLSRNYEILHSFLKRGVSSVELSDLVALGFNVAYVTSHDRLRNHERNMCFDIRYFQTPARIFGIEKVNVSLPETTTR